MSDAWVVSLAVTSGAAWNVSKNGVSTANQKRVVVTGASGFVGAALCRHLSRAGREVIALDRDWSGPLRAERTVGIERRWAIDLVDLDDTDVFRDAIVFHLAARPGVRHGCDESTFADNVVATRRLLEVLRCARPARLIYASSSSVYGRAAALPFREDGPMGAWTSSYARSKVIGEALVRRFHTDTRVPVVIARLFNVYGPRSRPDLAPPLMLERVLRGEPVTLAGDVARDLTYVDDVCEALERLSRVDVPELIVNVGSGTSVTMRELARRLGATSIVEGPPDTSDVPATRASIERLREVLGWVPGTALEAGLERFVAWTRSRS